MIKGLTMRLSDLIIVLLLIILPIMSCGINNTKSPISSEANDNNKNLKNSTSKIELAKEDDKDIKFLEQYDNSMPPQLIMEGIKAEGWWNYVAQIDKSANIFVFMCNSGESRGNSWFYTPSTDPPVSIFSDFSVGALQKCRVCTDTENNLVLFDLQEKDKKNNWKIMRILKWDGKKFSELKNIMIPKHMKERNNRDGIYPFLATYPEAEIHFIRPDADLKKILVCGSFYEKYFDWFPDAQNQRKTFLAILDTEKNEWETCQRIAGKGKFSTGDIQYIMKKNGDIYAVWDEEGDKGTKKYPARISFDRFDGKKWDGNQEISGEIPFRCGSPDITIDNMNNCHIVWDGAVELKAERYYYRQYSHNQQWSDIEEIPIGKNRPSRIYITCMNDGRPFIYWGLENTYHFSRDRIDWGSRDTIYCKIRLGDKLWSKTFRLDTEIDRGQFSLCFDSDNNLHIIWSKAQEEEGGYYRDSVNLYYKKLAHKK